MYTRVPNNTLIDLAGKTAIVTGSAGGIGKAAALRLHEAGANVVIADLNKDGADELAAELNQVRQNSAIGYGLNVANKKQVNELVEHVAERFDTLDILVNNAGIFPFQTLAEMTEDDFNRVLEVNTLSVFLFTKAVSEVMKRAKTKGKIINITSIDAVHPSMIGLAHYDASKHAVWGFTKNTALELAPAEITVNAIAPGGIATPGTGAIDGEPSASVNDFAALIPLQRMGNADEIAKAVLFVASDMASYMTGSQIIVDGGRLLK